MQTAVQAARGEYETGDLRSIPYRCWSVLFYKGNITAFHECFAIDEPTPDLPDIDILFLQLLTVIAIPAYANIIAFEKKHPLAIEYLQLEFK